MLCLRRLVRLLIKARVGRVVLEGGVSGALVKLGGRPIGQIEGATFSLRGLSEGQHWLEVELGGFHNWRRRIAVKAGKILAIASL